MKKIVAISILVAGIFTSADLFSQTALIKKADKHYKNLNYSQALKFYQKEYKKRNCCEENDKIIEKIASCYKLIGNTKSAEKWFEKLVNNKTVDKINYIYYAQMLQINGKYAEAKLWFNKYSESISNNKIISNFLLDESTIESMKNEVLKYDINLLSINSNQSEIGPAFYQNQLVFLSTRDTFSILRDGWKNEPFFDIYTTEIDTVGNYSEAKKFDKKLNSPYHEGPLCFHPKYDIVYFTRSNNKASNKNNEKINRLSIYQATKGKKGWTNIEKLWFNSTEHSYAHPTISPDGMVMIFTSDKEGGYGGTDLYFSFWNDSTWSEPINLGEKINTKGDELFPHFSEDGKLYFSSNGRKGLGGLDIFFTYPTFENIKEIRNMGMPVNSTNDDFGLIKDKNDKGYFVSNRPNDKFKNDNIYSFITYYYPTISDDTLEIPNTVHLNEKVTFDILKNKLKEKGNQDIQSMEIITDGAFAQEFRSDNDGMFTYWVNKSFGGVKKIDYVVTNKRGLKDTASIYLVMEGNTPPNAQSDRLYAVKNGKGRVVDIIKNDFDKEDNIMLDSIKIIEYPKHGGELIQERRYVYYLPPKNFVGKDYCVYEIKDTRGGIDRDTIYIDVLPEFMGKIVAMGKDLDLSIHFKFNKWRIDFLERKKLDKVALFLNENPTVVGQVTGHTDPVGGSNYNLLLSLKRAKATANYLSLKGISKTRIKIKGKGETDLIYKSLIANSKNDPKHLLNRRTTIKVLDY